MHNSHTMLLRALAGLLSYPDEDLREALPEIAEVLKTARGIHKSRVQPLQDLVRELGQGDLLDVQARYVELFDRGRSTSLNLFEHVHGDGRERGSAMLELRERFSRIGLEQSNHELPDHLPVLLEYLSCCPEQETPELLGECAHVLRKLGNALAKRESRYAAVPAALLDLAGEEGLDPHAPVPPPDDIDSNWAEPEAFERPDTHRPSAEVMP